MQNPLEIPEILAIVASNFHEYEDLKHVRKVNRNLMKETLVKWRSSAVFLINNETFPLLFKAFNESHLVGLSEEEREAVQAKKDPFLLKEVPFKKYRFTREQDWRYPLDRKELKKKLIWEKVISPHAIYLDVGECSLKEFCRYNLIGLKWILEHSKNVEELAMAPINSLVKVRAPPEVRHGSCNIPGEEHLWHLGPDPHCVRTFLDGFSAPKVNSLRIYYPSPRNYQRPPDMSWHCLGSSFHDSVEGVGIAKWFIGGMLPNLKKLELPWEDGATSIIQGLTEAASANNGYPQPVRLEKITATIPGTLRVLGPNYLKRYLTATNPPLKELSLSISEYRGQEHDVYHSLHAVSKTLKKLELHYNYNYSTPELYGFKYKAYFRPDRLLLENLTHFKVVQDYETSPGKLIKFDWSYLWTLPKLKTFHFGMKNKIDKAWVRRKINLAEIMSGSYRLDPNTVESVKLTDLKSFHFHGNLETSAIRRLERIMKNLETLEVVLDEENFHVVKGSHGKFDQLKNLKLLPCSDVPQSSISALLNSYPALRIEDESKKYSPALRKEIVVTLD